MELAEPESSSSSSNGSCGGSEESLVLVEDLARSDILNEYEELDSFSVRYHESIFNTRPMRYLDL